MNGNEKTMPKALHSACADAALRAEMRRVEKMTMAERMSEALALGRRFSAAQIPAKGK